MKNPLKKSVPLWAMIISIVLAIGITTAVVFWVGKQVTTITVPALIKPMITPTIVGLDIPVNTWKEVVFTITNPNDVPILVNSLWTVRINGTEIAKDKYSVDDLQNFVWMKHISTYPADEFGLNEATYDLIIPKKGYTEYTLVYYIPPNFTDPTTVFIVDFKYESIVEVEWNPKFTVYMGSFYNGNENWDNTFVPYWYPLPPPIP